MKTCRHKNERYWWSKRTYDPHDTKGLKAAIEVEQKVRFWGYEYAVTPCLVDEVFGNGRQLTWIEPLNTRPNYYVVRIDSRWDVADHADDILDAIAGQFGSKGDDLDPDDEDAEDSRGFPVLSDDSGYSWGRLEWPEKTTKATTR